jgi:phenylacetate-coenzyme A ligase PaaK-like adenylate-forming protein
VPSLLDYKKKIYDFHPQSFDSLALELFYFQAQHNPTYRDYLKHLHVTASEIVSVSKIPFLPIEMFKIFEIKTENWNEQKRFLSSGTTSKMRSFHCIEDIKYYHDHTQKIYEEFYGDLTNSTIMALLPSYLEQGDSGLISMIDSFIEQSSSAYSGYYLESFESLEKGLYSALKNNEQVILFGVTYALVEFAKQAKNQFSDLIVVETGGMKGRGEELTKLEVHNLLKEKLGLKNVHSEYGMTELLSQAYSRRGGVFECSNWMKIVVKDLNDPFNTIGNESVGIINIIDLANVHSCCFIESQDIGKKYSNGNFEILGRKDNSEVRGCNLLLE